MRWKSIGLWCWNNLSTIAQFGMWAVSAGGLPYLLSLNHGVTPVGYGLAAITGMLSFAAIRALWMRGKLWAIESKHREILGGNSSNFDPMAPVYQNKRLYLRDLFPPGRRILNDRKFINCEIVGPGNVVVALNKANGQPSVYANNGYNDVDCIQIISERPSLNALYFPGCDFEGCQFYNINLLFYNRVHDDWPWITPISDSPLLLTDAGNDG